VVDKLPDNTLRSKLIYYPEKNVWDLLNTKRFGSAFLCGSGKGRFGQLLNGMKQPLTIDKNLHPLIDSLNANLSTMVQFISLERFNPYYTVSDYWGAGFELIYWTGQVFEKLGEYAFIIHNAEYDKNFDIGYPIPNLILYYKYIGQDLLVTALDIKKAEQIIEQDSVRIISKFGDYSQYSYVVPTIDKMGKPISTDNIDFSFSTNILILGYTMNAKDKVATLPHISLNNPGAGLSFHVNGDIEYIMTKTIVDQLRENGNNAYKNRHAK
jgi:hypothetical protein